MRIALNLVKDDQARVSVLEIPVPLMAVQICFENVTRY